MDEWQKFNEPSLPEKDDFCSNLNMDNITHADSLHAKRFCNDFEIKRLLNIIISILKLIHY